MVAPPLTIREQVRMSSSSSSSSTLDSATPPNGYVAGYAAKSLELCPPEDCTPEDKLLEKICELAIEGRSLREIAAELSMKLLVIQRFLMADKQRNELFNLARMDGHEVLADDLMSMHRQQGMSDAVKRIHSTNLMWLLSRRLKERYSEKIEVDNNSRVSITDALMEARGRLPSPSSSASGGGGYMEGRVVDSEEEIIGEVDELGRPLDKEDCLLPPADPSVEGYRFDDEEDEDRGELSRRIESGVDED